MQKTDKRKRIQNGIQIALIVAFCISTLVLDVVCCRYFNDRLRKTLVCKLIQQLCGAMAAILFMLRLKIRLFGKPQKWLYLLPCLLIAIDNFQFGSYFNGRMELVYRKPTDIFLFGVYCLSVGLFEECIFRGVIFALLAGLLPKNKKGFLWCYLVSSLVFGLMHVLNGFSGAALLQAGYSILTGGLFAFCLVKTKNILCCAFVHGLYNFCGLLFGVYNQSQCVIGLGGGVVFDRITIITMTVVSVFVGIFVLYKVFTYSDKERVELYQKLGIHEKNKAKTERYDAHNSL